MRSGAFFLRTCASKLLVGGRGWDVEIRPCTDGEDRETGAVGFRRAWTESNQRGGARTRRKRPCCASSQEKERAHAMALFFLRTCASKLLVGGRGWHVRIRPCTDGEDRETGAVGFRRAWTESNQRGGARASRKRPYCASSRERESAGAVALFFLRTCASKLLIGGRGWHVEARPCTDGEDRETGTVGFRRAWTESNQRGGARARRKRPCCASFRERESERNGAFFLAHMRQ